MTIHFKRRFLLAFDYLCNLYHDPTSTWKNQHVDRKTGISKVEKLMLDRFIRDNLFKWKDRLEKEHKDFSFRVEKDTTGLPRTLHILRDPSGQLRVMVLCKRKRIDQVGNGSYKKTTKAVDWLTKEQWAYSTTRDLLSSVVREWKMERIAQSHPLARNVKTPSFGLLYYTHQNKSKMGFFSPLREGNLWSCNFAQLDETQKMGIMRSSLETLVLLEELKIEHRDIKLGNILFWKEGNNIKTELIDFGVARRETETMTQEDLSEKYTITGVQNLFSPELRRAELLASTLNNQTASHQLRANSWTKTDIWNMGIVLYAILQGKDKHLTGFTERNQIVNFIFDRLTDVSEVMVNDDLFMKEIFKGKEALFDEPPKDTPLHLVWQMLQIDYRKRVSATDLYEQFNRLFPVAALPAAPLPVS